MKLVVGSIDQKIEVTGTAPLLETQGTNLGRIMSAQAIQDLPLTVGGGCGVPPPSFNADAGGPRQ